MRPVEIAAAFILVLARAGGGSAPAALAGTRWIPTPTPPGAVQRTPSSSQGTKARQPFDFIVAGLRALGVTPETLLALDPRPFRRLILEPLAAMGQPFHQAPGPDGWPEAQSHWITAQGLAARIDWAMQAPQRLQRPLPDPRAFLATALGPRAGERLVWAVSAAESARDGVGLVLASPEFNRR